MNRLFLPPLEFENLYTRHLLLKELLNSDISLYTLSICFIRRKTIAFALYKSCYKVVQEGCCKEVMQLLINLENRFIDLLMVLLPIKLHMLQMINIVNFMTIHITYC